MGKVITVYLTNEELEYIRELEDIYKTNRSRIIKHLILEEYKKRVERGNNEN